MTYARARLLLGISGVGTTVVLAALTLWMGLPNAVFSTGPVPWWQAAGELLALMVAYITVALPFDFMGGYTLPCHFGRLCLGPVMFLAGWVRGVFVQILVMTLLGLCLIQAGRFAGLWGAAAVLAASMYLLLAIQLPLALWTGRLHRSLPDTGAAEPHLARWHQVMPQSVAVSGMDGGFVGGVVGMPGHERLVLPAQWLQELPAGVLAAQIVRRIGVLRTGSRRRGVLVAAAWNLIGFVLSALVTGSDVGTVAGFVTTSLGTTLWSFAGLLLLPTLSRYGVFEADRYALQAGVPAALLEETMAELDRRQDDEPIRAPLVEKIFHPCPSIQNRQARLRGAEGSTGAWQAARLALFLSWAQMGFLSRAVHCNSGRPELWVLFPGD